MATIKIPPSVFAQFRYLLAFEHGLFFKKIGIYGVLLAFLGIGFLCSTRISAMSMANTYRNSPFAITYLLGFMSIVCLFSSSVLATQVLFREKDSRFSLILYATPLNKWAYFSSRFLTVFGLTAGSFGLFILGFALGQSQITPENVEYGPFNAWFYLQPFLLFIVPNAFFCSAIVCSTAWLTQNKLLVYVSALFVYIAYMVTLIFSGSPLMSHGFPQSAEAMNTAAQFDPFGVSAFVQQTLYWSALERNTMVTTFTGNILFNRLFFSALSLILLGFSFYKWVFYSTEKIKKNKEIKEETNEGISQISVYPTVLLELFTVKYRLKSLLSFVRIDLKFTVKSIPFVLILLGIGFYLSMEIYGEIEKGIRLPQKYATTGLMVNVILDNFPALCNLIILFYSHELIAKSRSAHFDLIENSTPLSITTLFLSKWTTINCIIVFFLAWVSLVGIVFQLFYGVFTIELTLYFSLFFWTAWPLILSSGLIILIQFILKNKYISLIAAAIFLLSTTTSLGKFLHMTHPLLRFGSGYDGKYSDINGFGAYVYPFALKAIFGSLVTFLLVFLAFYGQKWKKWVKKPMVVLSFFLTFLGTSVLGFYIHNRLDLTSKKADLDWQQMYETTYRPFQNLAQPTVTDIKTMIDLFPEKNVYKVAATYTLKNLTDTPIDKLLLYVDSDILLKNMHVERSKSTEIDKHSGHIWLTLSTPLQPKDSLKADFEFSYAWNIFTKHRSFNAIVENGAFMRISNYFPRLGYQSDNEIADKKERNARKMGENTPLRTLEDPKTAQNDWIQLDLTISTAHNQTAIGVGEWVKTEKNADRNVFYYKTSTPIPPRFGIASACYAVEKSTHRGIGIEVFYHPTHDKNVARLIENAKNTLDYCENNFGKYPFTTIRFAEISAFSKGFAATAYPSTIFMAEDIIFNANIQADKQQDVINELAGHELAHEWWGAHQLSPDEREGAKFLTETFAMYTELMLVKKMYGSKRVLENVRMHRDMYLSERGFADEQPLFKTVKENTYQHYSKGLVTMYQLSELIGEERVNQALKNLLQKKAYANIAPISTDFLNELYAVSPLNLHTKIDDLFKRIMTYSIDIQNITSKKTTNQYTVNFDINALKYEENGKGEKKTLAFDDTVEIAFYFKNGQERIVKYPIANGALHININFEEKPTQLVVDPRELFIKVNERDTYNLD